MDYSSKFVEKFIGVTLKPITNENFIRSFIRWTIDSKYRTTKAIDKFLKDQIISPDSNVLKIAKSLRCKTQDETIINVLKYVKSNLIYQSDQINFGKVEYWAQTAETLIRKYSDCEDANSAIYVLARLAGVPQIKLWSVLGDTSSGYHYYLVYFSTDRDMFFSIDGTFYPDLTPIKTRKPFVINKNTYTKIDYLFNEENIFKS